MILSHRTGCRKRWHNSLKVDTETMSVTVDGISNRDLRIDLASYRLGAEVCWCVKAFDRYVRGLPLASSEEGLEIHGFRQLADLPAFRWVRRLHSRVLPKVLETFKVSPRARKVDGTELVCRILTSRGFPVAQVNGCVQFRSRARDNGVWSVDLGWPLGRPMVVRYAETVNFDWPAAFNLPPIDCTDSRLLAADAVEAMIRQAEVRAVEVTERMHFANDRAHAHSGPSNHTSLVAFTDDFEGVGLRLKTGPLSDAEIKFLKTRLSAALRVVDRRHRR